MSFSSSLWWLVLIGLPVGILIAKYAKDEIQSGKKYFYGLFVLGFISAIYFSYVGNILIAICSVYLEIVVVISIFAGRRGKYKKQIGGK